MMTIMTDNLNKTKNRLIVKQVIHNPSSIQVSKKEAFIQRQEQYSYLISQPLHGSPRRFCFMNLNKCIKLYCDIYVWDYRQ